VFELRFSESVVRELRGIAMFHRNVILDAIEQQLVQAPGVPSKRRKVLLNVSPGFETVPPVWQLRVGPYRVFYDIDDDGSIVYIRAVRLKPAHKTTGDIL